MTEQKTGLIERAVPGDPAAGDLFRAVFERIQTAILVIDPAAHRIVDANPLMEALTGYSRNQMLGNGCQQFVCPAKCGECPVTDLHKNILNIEREVIRANGVHVPVLKTVAKAEIGGKEYLIESFTDFTDHKRAEERQRALIAYLSETILRVKKPLELIQENLRDLAGQTASGEYDAEDIRMQLQINGNNLGQIIKNLEELKQNAIEGREDEIPAEFKEFFTGRT